MRFPTTGALGACAIFAAGLLSACGKGTPLTSGTATPPPPFIPQVTSEYVIPTADSQPVGITLGSDGNLWFTEFGHQQDRATEPAGEVHRERSRRRPRPRPNGIASGPNGLVWFTETNVSKIGQITLDGPTFTDFQLPNPAARPTGIALGSDGNMWVTDPGTSSIWRIDQKGNAAGASSRRRAAAGDRERSRRRDVVHRTRHEQHRTPSGRRRLLPLAEFKIPTANADPAGIAPGTDNALWFTERHRASSDASPSPGRSPMSIRSRGATPDAVIQGIDGNFYFTDTQGNFRCEYEAVDDLGQMSVGERVGRQDRGSDAAAGGPGDADRDDRREDGSPDPVPDRPRWPSRRRR